MQKRQVLINAIMSVTQIVVISIVLFILYRFLLKTIGVKQLGIWSLVLATTSVSQIASFGLSGSVVKFVAKYLARKENKNVSELIQTAVLSVGLFVGCFLVICYPAIKWLLKLVIPNESISIALSILPYAFFALWIMVMTSIFQSGLDGYQRIDIRSFLLMGGALLHLFLCFILAPKYGLLGVAYARVIQNLSVFLVSWLILRKLITELPVFPYRWNKTLFKEIIGYGINFQIISIAAMLYDPTTKALLSKFGGLSMVGYYEMANKLVHQFRSLIVSANQVLVPAIADLKERIPNNIHKVYITSYRMLFYLALPLFSIIIISLPLISRIWIGHYEKVFILFGVLLTVGWALNTLNAPAYFVYLGIGVLRWNVASHIAIGILNLCLGILFGLYFDGIGVVIAWVISLVLGSSIIYISYHLKNKIPLVELIPKESRKIFGVCLIGVILILIIQQKINLAQSFDIIILNSIIILIYGIIIFTLFWFHPMRSRLIGWVNNELLRKS